jgi:hypothetical protein
MPTAAFATTIKVGGPSTAFTGDATTVVAANTVYQITNTAKRIIDPSVAIVVEVDADGAGAGAYVTASASTYTVDYLFGKITFASDQGASALVRVSGAYLTPVDVAEAKEFDLSVSRDVQDASYFVSDGFKRKLVTLKDCSGSVSSLVPLQRDMDPGAGSTVLSTLFSSGTPFIIEIRLGGAGQYFRAWALIESTDHKSQVGSMLESSFKWNSAPVLGTGRTDRAVFGFGT